MKLKCIKGIKLLIVNVNTDDGLGQAYTGQNQVFLAGYGKYKRRTCLTDQVKHSES